MEAWVRLTALLIVTVGSNGAPTVRGQDPTTLAGAIAAYNRATEVTSLFRLYEDDPETRQDTSTSPKQLRFTIKETVCPKQMDAQPIDECAFKDSGVVKNCTVTIFEKLGVKNVLVTCATVTVNALVRRRRQVHHCPMVVGGCTVTIFETFGIMTPVITCEMVTENPRIRIRRQAPQYTRREFRKNHPGSYTCI